MNSQEIRVTYDFSSAEKLIEILDKNELLESDFQELMILKGTKAYLNKMSSFFPNINERSFKKSLGLAVLGTPNKKDPFMMDRVIKSIPLAKKLITKIKEQQDDISEKSKLLLSRYTPNRIKIEAKVYLILGIVGGGWTFGDDPNSFFIDATSIGEDIDGLVYLCTHELYHLVQAQFMSAKPQTEKVAYLIDKMIREGSASYVADFSKATSSGTYLDFNKKNYQRNFSRLKSNFQLFESLISHANFNNESDIESLYDIGFNGTYQSPLYFVGYHMVKLIEKYRDRNVLVELLKENPKNLVFEYQMLCVQYGEKDNEFTPLSKGTLEILENLEY